MISITDFWHLGKHYSIVDKDARTLIGNNTADIQALETKLTEEVSRSTSANNSALSKISSLGTKVDGHYIKATNTFAADAKALDDETFKAVTNSASCSTAAQAAAADAASSREAAEAAQHTLISRVETAQTACEAAVNQTTSSASTAITKASEASTSAASASTSASTASSSASAALSSANAASTSSTNAATSELQAATSASNAATSVTQAATSAANSATSETNAASSAATATTKASDASASATIAKESETNAAASETAAGASASAASASATAAKTSETNAKASETAATTSKTDAASSAKESKSYAVGGTGTRSGEDTDNSKYWCQQAHDISTGVTGVKGDSESTYRKGDVNITKANIGLGNVDNTSDADKPISTAGQTALDSTNSAVSDIIRKVNQIDYTKSWADILADCESGNASRWYSIGDTITEPWTDTSNSTAYDNPWRVNSFADETLQDGTVHHGMWLQNVYAHPFGVQFSHQRAFCKCPDGLSAGTYHIKFAQAWGKALANTPYQFTIAADVAAGCRLAGFYYMADNEPSTYKVYVYSADGKTIIETCVVTQGEGGTDLGTLNYTTRNGNLNSMQETAYGWNRNLSSAVRQYLNSEADKNLWWTAYDEWDIAPDQLSSKAGYLSGLPDDMKAVIQAVKTTTYTNTVQDGGGADITYDKVILPSLEQMYINPQIAGEGAVHEYWKQVNGTDTPYPWYTNTPALIHYAVENHTNAQCVRLRSASRGGANGAWYVNQSGGVNGNNADYSYRFAPLVFI